MHIWHRSQNNVFGQAVKESKYVGSSPMFKERPRHFFSDTRPRRGRHVLAPRDRSDPATLPTVLQDTKAQLRLDSGDPRQGHASA